MYESDNSQELLQRLKADDQSAIKEIFHNYYGLVYKTTAQLCNDAQIAEDLCQNVFTNFWRKRHTLHIKGPIAPYIKRMAVNEALAWLKKQKRMPIDEVEEQNLPPILTADADEQYMYGEMKQVIGQAIEKLPPRCQTVFKLSRYEEMTYKEISKEMDITEKTVENQMGRALKLLRKFLKGYLRIFF